MKQLLSAVTLSLGLAASMAATTAHAIGTNAGTEIINSATVTYGPANNQTVSDPVTATFNVDEIININVTALDSNNNVDVNAGDTASVQAYRISNTGNGAEVFSLEQISTGDFAPDTSIYYEKVDGGNGQFDGTESIYISGADFNLDPDEEYYIYLVSNIPAGAAIGQTSTLTFEAISKTPGASSAPIGGILSGQGTAGTDAVVAILNATGNGAETYTVIALPPVTVDIIKSIVSVITDIDGTQVTGQYIPGATVKYLIAVTVTGAGNAENLEIIDSLPADMTYVTNTLVQQIDSAGGFTAVASANGGYDADSHKVSVRFGNQPAGTYEIQLDATIN